MDIGTGSQQAIGGAATRSTATADAAQIWHDRERPLVLIVEDDPHDWELYGKILYYNGYDVMYASDGESGYVLAQLHHPDLILLDLVMPRLDGLALCARLQGTPEQAHIPVVVLSACSEREFGPRARAAGCVRYLEKPARPVQVLHEIEAIIGRPPAPGVGRPPLEHPAVA